MSTWKVRELNPSSASFYLSDLEVVTPEPLFSYLCDGKETKGSEEE